MNNRRAFIAGLFALPFMLVPAKAKPTNATVRYTLNIEDVKRFLDECGYVTAESLKTHPGLLRRAVKQHLRLDRRSTAEFLKGERVISGPTIKFPTSI